MMYSSKKLSPENTSKNITAGFFIPASNHIVHIKSYTEFLFTDMLIVLKSLDPRLPTFVRVKLYTIIFYNRII